MLTAGHVQARSADGLQARQQTAQIACKLECSRRADRAAQGYMAFLATHCSQNRLTVFCPFPLN